MVIWKKCGLIYCPDGKGFFKTHATRPIPYRLDEKVLRVFFSSRSKEDMPYPTYIDVDIENPKRILKVNEKPLMQLGRRGTFDDSGITPVSILRGDKEERMYYVGWKRRRYGGVSIETAIGLAWLKDKGERLVRAYEGPILGQDIHHPIMVAAPFVIFDDGKYKMWYCSGLEWRTGENGNPEPIYTVFYAESKDGIKWDPHGKPVICPDYDGEVISAPWVMKIGDVYHMWYSKRGYKSRVDKRFTIGYAVSFDGISWERKDYLAGITVSDSGWDAEMVCYPAFYPYRDRVYMFYSGNGSGRDGFGYAVADNFLEG